MKIAAILACLLAAGPLITPQKNNKVVQIDISDLLNSRPVTTLTGGKLITWKKGIDGGGDGDGYLTLSAALANGDKEPHALPDDPLYPATDSHPAVKLYYANADSLASQAWSIAGVGGGGFAVPHAKYKSFFIAVTSSEGPSTLKVQFSYQDGDEEKDFIVPDYYNDIPPADTNKISYLAHDLAKWGNKNNMTEKNHHNIDLLNITPNPARRLLSIDVQKEKSGYLVIWAVAGEKI